MFCHIALLTNIIVKMNNNTYTKMSLLLAILLMVVPCSVSLKSSFSITKSYLQSESSVIAMGSLSIFE